MADDMIATYAGLAESWNSERGSYRMTPVRDALTRGGPWPSGICLDIGAREVVRVLRPDGVVVWSNALGTDAPHHVPPDQVQEAISAASDASWRAISSEAGWKSWAVLRRRQRERR